MADNIGSANIELTLTTDKFSSALKNAESQVGSSIGAMTGVLSHLAGPLAAAFSIHAFESFISGLGQSSLELEKLSSKLNMSTTSIQELQFVAKEAGLSFDTISTGITMLTKKLPDMENASSRAGTIVKDLGISLNDTSGHIKSQSELFLEFADAVSKIENPTLRAQVAQELFGRSGMNLLPILSQGRAAIEAQMKAAEDNGQVMGETAVKAYADYEKAVDRAGQSLKVFAGTVLVPIVDLFTTLLDGITAATSALEKFGNMLPDLTGKSGEANNLFGTSVQLKNTSSTAVEAGTHGNSSPLSPSSINPTSTVSPSTSDNSTSISTEISKGADQGVAQAKAAVKTIGQGDIDQQQLADDLVKGIKDGVAASKKELSDLLAEGKITTADFETQWKALDNYKVESVKDLIKDLQDGKLSVDDFSKEFQTKMDEANKAAKQTTDQIGSNFQSLFSSIGSSMGGGGLGGGLLGAIFSPILGGIGKNIGLSVGNAINLKFPTTGVQDASYGHLFDGIAGHANGGYTAPNTPYMVGEQGPELFVPSASGSIVPNGGSGAGKQVVVNQNNNFTSVDAVNRSILNQALNANQSQTVAAVLQMMQSGGAMSKTIRG